MWDPRPRVCQRHREKRPRAAPAASPFNRLTCPPYPFSKFQVGGGKQQQQPTGMLAQQRMCTRRLWGSRFWSTSRREAQPARANRTIVPRLCRPHHTVLSTLSPSQFQLAPVTVRRDANLDNEQDGTTLQTVAVVGLEDECRLASWWRRLLATAIDLGIPELLAHVLWSDLRLVQDFLSAGSSRATTRLCRWPG